MNPAAGMWRMSTTKAYSTLLLGFFVALTSTFVLGTGYDVVAVSRVSAVVFADDSEVRTDPNATRGVSSLTRLGIDVSELRLTGTVSSHLDDLTKTGEAARPYLNSRLTMREIMEAADPIPDPGGVPGALRWDVPGAFRGSEGTWQLVVDPSSNTVLHFLFRSGG